MKQFVAQTARGTDAAIRHTSEFMVFGEKATFQFMYTSKW